jgi:hypothetical protein
MDMWDSPQGLPSGGLRTNATFHRIDNTHSAAISSDSTSPPHLTTAGVVIFASYPLPAFRAARLGDAASNHMQERHRFRRCSSHLISCKGPLCALCLAQPGTARQTATANAKRQRDRQNQRMDESYRAKASVCELIALPHSGHTPEVLPVRE